MHTDRTRLEPHHEHVSPGSAVVRCPDLSWVLTRANDGGHATASQVSGELVLFMATRLRAQTADCIMATFGISVNTWNKLKKGQPIRTSVAQRLVTRVAANEAAARVSG